MSETNEIILLGPIPYIHGSTDSSLFKCVDDSTHFTSPVLSGSNGDFGGAVSGGKMPNAPSGSNVFNLYRANGAGVAGSDQGYRSSRASGEIKFGVSPCAEKIEFEVVGRADIYAPAGFDTFYIEVAGSQIAYLSNTGANNTNLQNGVYNPALSGTTTHSQTFTHNFPTSNRPPCGYAVKIYGLSGSLANNNVGYDVKITVTPNS
jgi:hypothetical protein